MTSQLIPQQYVGRMNVVGDCFVFGAALHDNQPVYLDIAGPARARETSGDQVKGASGVGVRTLVEVAVGLAGK